MKTHVIKQEFTPAKDHTLLVRFAPHYLPHSERSRVGGGFDDVEQPELLAPKNLTLTNLTNDLLEDEVRAVK